MSIMAFEFSLIEMNFALSEFEFKVFTLEIDFQFRILTSGNRFSNLNVLLLMATLGHRSYEFFGITVKTLKIVSKTDILRNRFKAVRLAEVIARHDLTAKYG